MIEDLVLVGGVTLALVVLFIIWPFVSLPSRTRYRRVASHMLEDQLEFLVQAVRDLDSDYDTGKLSQADYIQQRKFLIGRGVSTLMRLDEARADEAVAEDEIEALVAAYRQAN